MPSSDLCMHRLQGLLGSRWRSNYEDTETFIWYKAVGLFLGLTPSYKLILQKATFQSELISSRTKPSPSLSGLPFGLGEGYVIFIASCVFTSQRTIIWVDEKDKHLHIEIQENTTLLPALCPLPALQLLIPGTQTTSYLICERKSSRYAYISANHKHKIPLKQLFKFFFKENVCPH